MRVMELVTEIATGAAQNTNIVWIIEFQEELVERLYRKMMALLDEDSDGDEDEDEVKERGKKKR